MFSVRDDAVKSVLVDRKMEQTATLQFSRILPLCALASSPLTDYPIDRASSPCFPAAPASMSDTLHYITDENGQRTAVVVPLVKYEKLLEDLDHLAARSQACLATSSWPS
jgi:hypothetical protein